MPIVMGVFSGTIQSLLGEEVLQSFPRCLHMGGCAQALVYTLLSEFQTEEEQRVICGISIRRYADSVTLTFHCAIS